MGGRPMTRPTAAKTRTMQLLLDARERGDGWAFAIDLAKAAKLTYGSTYSCLQSLYILGWVELRLDESQDRRVGKRGRRPRQAYRLTDKGKTALVESLMQLGDET